MRLLNIYIIFSFLIFAYPPASHAESAQEESFVRQFMVEVQRLSILKAREYCGFIGISRKGEIVATPPARGERASCRLVTPSANEMTVIASYHSHGQHDRGYENELPSTTDIQSDLSMGLRGWVSTPGGRLWMIDSKSMWIKEICPIGCLPMDRKFNKADSGVLQRAYSYEALTAHFK